MFLLDSRTLASASGKYITKLFKTDLRVILRTLERCLNSIFATKFMRKEETLAFKSSFMYTKIRLKNYALVL